MFNFFKRQTYQELSRFYQEEQEPAQLSRYDWLALAANERTLEQSLLTKEIVLTSANKEKKSPLTVSLAELSQGIYQKVYSGREQIFMGPLKDESEAREIKKLFNRLFDSYIEREIGFFTEAMNKSTSSPRQLEAEEKAVEWIRVSFEVLTKAAIESLTNPDYLFQATLFAGVNPKTRMREIRLITFNLDMTFVLLPDQNLRVLIYNKKPGEKLEDLKPALMGDYSFRKREILDQLIGLLSVLSKGFHA